MKKFKMFLLMATFSLLINKNSFSCNGTIDLTGPNYPMCDGTPPQGSDLHRVNDDGLASSAQGWRWKCTNCTFIYNGQLTNDVTGDIIFNGSPGGMWFFVNPEQLQFI